MLNEAIVQRIIDIVGETRKLFDEPMCNHTTFRTGGNADALIKPSSINHIEPLFGLLKKNDVPYIVLGNGSNVLVGDKGIRGVVIQLGNEFGQVNVENTKIKAQSGIKLSRLASIAYKNNLTGLEFAGGIPGTLGGAVFMNAGAYGGEMSQVVTEVTYFDTDGKVKSIDGKDCDFGYRTSFFEKNKGAVVLGCTIELREGNPCEIKAMMDDFAERRSSKQPLNLPSAGSTFKRPEGYFAGKLIQDADLIGLRVGGASVSTKHAGFVVNDKNATSKDVMDLIKLVQEKVYEKFGVMLEPEVRFIGEF